MGTLVCLGIPAYVELWFYSNVEDPNDRGYDAIRHVFLNMIIRESSLPSTPHRPPAASLSQFTRY